MTSLAITVLGHDRPGIIAEVTKSLAEIGGNLEDSSMTLLRGHFAMTLVVDLLVTLDEVQARLSHLSSDALRVVVLPIIPPEEANASGPRFLLSVHGADKPGIVSSITEVVAAHGGNIVDLTTRLGSSLYVLVAEVELQDPDAAGPLRQSLTTVAASIGVDVTFRAAEIDTL